MDQRRGIGASVLKGSAESVRQNGKRSRLGYGQWASHRALSRGLGTGRCKCQLGVGRRICGRCAVVSCELCGAHVSDRGRHPV